uniref:Uncharacterized protein n=1 Tax=Tanacetum cinerariifolium TaxID=118510 RepID=A0A699GXP1_TANCI|nr:hypothetical protein [Tanacetum cinerariifolium]
MIGEMKTSLTLRKTNKFQKTRIISQKENLTRRSPGRPPLSRPSQDSRGQGSLGGSREQSWVDDFTTLISNRFGTRVVHYKEFEELIQPFEDPERVSQLDRKLLKTTNLDRLSFIGTRPYY